MWHAVIWREDFTEGSFGFLFGQMGGHVSNVEQRLGKGLGKDLC
jgi:hypothetical protein